jgi:hypothetical protein
VLLAVEDEDVVNCGCLNDFKSKLQSRSSVALSLSRSSEHIISDALEDSSTVMRCSYLILVSLAAARAVPPPSPLAPHPRLVLTHARVAALQTAIAEGGDAALFAEQLFAHAAWVLTVPPQERGTPDSSGVLIHVRTALDYLLTSAAAHRLNASGGVYLARAVAEGLNLAQNWSDWNTQQHALDTGEALFAMGAAYDWLYEDLTPAQRTAFLVDGIVTRGLIPYKQYIGTSTFWWINNTINWDCVCTSGGVISVLASLGDEGLPSWAWDSIVNPLIAGVRPCIGAYNTDSSWQEGPAYWGYASKYNAWLFAGLTDVLGSTLSLTDIPGVEGAALFPLFSTGAGALSGTAETFNWADAGTAQEWTPFAQWWGGAPFYDAAAAWWSRAGSRLLGPASLRSPAWGGFVEALAFFTPLGTIADVTKLPTAKLYDVINVGVLRSAWDAPPAEQNFVSFKGGDSGWNHNHLDLSTFVYDLAGVRLAEDMGADNYERAFDTEKLAIRPQFTQSLQRPPALLLAAHRPPPPPPYISPGLLWPAALGLLPPQLVRAALEEPPLP